MERSPQKPSRTAGSAVWPIPSALLNRLGPAGRKRAEMERLFLEGRRRRLPEAVWGMRRPVVLWTVERFLRMTGMFARGERELRSPQVTEHAFFVPGLPGELDGLRILHLSDLHLDFVPELAEILAGWLADLSYDLTVFTGDFVDRMREEETRGILEDGMARILAVVRGPRFGVLGNHDLLCVAEILETQGLPVLLNEAALVPHKGATLGLVGVDDPHLFRSHDLRRARARVPEGVFPLLLAHSPVIAEEAANAGFPLCLCGHTHAGQICLPGLPRLNGGRGIPPNRVSGAWRCGPMQGYTSRGIGASGLPVRLRAPPEIVIHTLRPTENSPPFA